MTRWMAVHRGSGGVDLVPAECGEWVRYRDHAAEIARLRARLDELKPKYDPRFRGPDGVRVGIKVV